MNQIQELKWLPYPENKPTIEEGDFLVNHDGRMVIEHWDCYGFRDGADDDVHDFLPVPIPDYIPPKPEYDDLIRTIVDQIESRRPRYKQRVAMECIVHLLKENKKELQEKYKKLKMDDL